MNDKFEALAALVREARAEDARTLKILEEATAAWKAANRTLTERLAVLNGYTAQLVNERTRLDAELTDAPPA